MNLCKVVHVVQGKVNVDRPNGVNAVIDGIARNIADKVDLTVIGISKGVRPGDIVQRDRYVVTLFPDSGSALTYFKSIKEVSIVHLHSVWQWTNYVFASYLIKNNIKYVITLHSGLSPDRVRKSKFLLRLAYHKLFQKFILDNAFFIQALTQEESTDIMKWTLNRQVKVIPNGVKDLSEYKTQLCRSDSQIVLGYLGRFGYEKNIDSLIDSLLCLPDNLRSCLRVELLGPKTEEYNQLISKVQHNNLQNNVIFLGAHFGDDKYKIMQKWTGYIHVAHSDVVSIAVMEAFSIGLPAIIARTCHVSYFYNSDAFIMVEPHPISIAQGITKFIQERSNWESMGNSAKELAREVFNWKIIADSLLIEYKRGSIL